MSRWVDLSTLKFRFSFTSLLLTLAPAFTVNGILHKIPVGILLRPVLAIKKK